MSAWIWPIVAALPILPRFLLLAWVLGLLAMPALKNRWGAEAERRTINLGVLLQTATGLTMLATTWGLGPTLRVALLVLALGWGVEYLGAHTGLPFGRYHYTARLQPQVGGVPLLIPLAWLMMFPPAWAVARLVAGGPGIAFVLTAALAFTAWDLFLDPQMVAWGCWVWDQPGGYFGIPWQNYAGWLLSAAVMTALAAPQNVPAPFPTAPLLLVYTLTWLLQSFAQFVFWKLRGPALCGTIGMGLWMAWAWLSM
jgi:putative membrane protein